MVDNAGDAVNTSSMGGGPGSLVGGGTMDGPKGRLGKNLLEAKNEMEAMGEERERQAAEPEEEEQAAGGIILRKKGGRDGGGGKLPSKGEVSALRSSIQTLWPELEPAWKVPRVCSGGPRGDGQGVGVVARGAP